MPIRHTVWAGLLFFAAAGWGTTPPAAAACTAAGVLVCFAAGWVRDRRPRRYTRQELGSVWEN